MTDENKSEHQRTVAYFTETNDGMFLQCTLGMPGIVLSA